MRTRRLIAAAAVVWGLALAYAVQAPPAAVVAHGAQPPATPPAAATPSGPANTDCLDCHADASTTRADGRPVVVQPAVFDASIHREVACIDCHADLAGAELPHAEDLKPVDCSTCHSEAVDQYKVSVHARARAQGSSVAAGCVDCHGAHDIRPKSDPESRTHHLKIAATCGSCHGNADVAAKGGMRGDVTTSFADSIHGVALARSGLVVAPTCSSCHGAHDVREKADPQSRVALPNVASTCGTCHQGLARQFGGGVHAAILKARSNGAPGCQTCHTAHAIGGSDDPAWQLSVINQCGTCHANRLATFRDTFHGQVSALGSRSVAGCADCHGAHEVLPASDPRSPIAPANLVKTCGQCHANANENFVKYDPHADKHNRERNAALFYTSRFMTALLVAVFGFFGLHTTLWFRKEISVSRARRKGTGE